MQTHYISGAWFNSNKKITHVLLHPINPDGTFQFGVKANLEQVIYAIQSNKAIVKAIIWNYTCGDWEIGPQVTVSRDNYLEYMEKNPDELNIENLIKLNALMNC
jgi:hypothetical protein